MGKHAIKTSKQRTQCRNQKLNQGRNTPRSPRGAFVLWKRVVGRSVTGRRSTAWSISCAVQLVQADCCRLPAGDAHSTAEHYQTHIPRCCLQIQPNQFPRHFFLKFQKTAPSLPALGPWAPPSRPGPLARKYLSGFPYSWSLRSRIHSTLD